MLDYVGGLPLQESRESAAEEEEKKKKRSEENKEVTQETVCFGDVILISLLFSCDCFSSPGKGL